jgi:hypothetical protein
LLIARLAQLAAKHGIHFSRGAELADTEIGQFLTHGRNEEFGVCHNLTIIA